MSMGDHNFLDNPDLHSHQGPFRGERRDHIVDLKTCKKQFRVEIRAFVEGKQ